MSTDDYRRRFADFLAAQPGTEEITYEDVRRAQSREELGITSLAMILLVLNYIKEFTGGTVTLQPEWVSHLNDIDGIVSVLRQIDELGATRAAV